MPSFKFVYERPNTPVAAEISGGIYGATRVRIAVGFLTKSGFKLIEDTLALRTLDLLVVGFPNLHASELLHSLEDSVPTGALRIHLGSVRSDEIGSRARGICRPMMHAKVYLADFADGTSWALVGSHNMTFYAFAGENAESGVIARGRTDDPFFLELASFLETLRDESSVFDYSLRDKYARMNNLTLNASGDRLDSDDYFDDHTPTIVFLAACIDPGQAVPIAGEVIYIEIPREYEREFERLKTEVHLFLYPRGRFKAGSTVAKGDVLGYRATMSGANDSNQDSAGAGRRMFEDEAEWMIRDWFDPRLERRTSPIANPRLPLQVRLQIVEPFGQGDEYEYHDGSRPSKQPILIPGERRGQAELAGNPEVADIYRGKEIPERGEVWHDVVGFEDMDKNAGVSILRPLDIWDIQRRKATEVTAREIPAYIQRVRKRRKSR